MAKEALAVKYRPHTWEDVVEQDSTKIILKQQLETNEFQHAYLFVGGAGTGKTTCARIFANEINQNSGAYIELDAASNSGVENVRNIIQQAKTASLDSEYKLFIIDECHSLSDTAWQAFLKLIEEPPAKSIFIFCTTDKHKIPKTILSRVQEFSFQRISQKSIANRLEYILQQEGYSKYTREAIEYISKLSEGGMRTSISLMDKCLSYNYNLNMENVVKALGVVDYDVMRSLTNAIMVKDSKCIIEVIEEVHMSGKDLKQFIRQYMNFVVDIAKYNVIPTFDYIQIPNIETNQNFLDKITKVYGSSINELLELVVKINSEVKHDSSPKYLIEAMLIGGDEQ